MKKMKKLSSVIAALCLVTTPARPADPLEGLRNAVIGGAVIAVAGGLLYFAATAPHYCPECGGKIEYNNGNFVWCSKSLHKFHPFCYKRAHSNCKHCVEYERYLTQQEQDRQRKADQKAQQVVDDHAMAQRLAEQESRAAHGGGYVSPEQARRDQCEAHGEHYAVREATHESARTYGSTTAAQTTNNQTDAHGGYYAHKIDQQQGHNAGQGSSGHVFTQEEMQQDCRICFTGKLSELEDGTTVNLNNNRYRDHVTKIPCRCYKGKGRWFHTACLKQWVQACKSKNQNPRCPVCNDQFNEKNVFKNS